MLKIQVKRRLGKMAWNSRALQGLQRKLRGLPAGRQRLSSSRRRSRRSRRAAQAPARVTAAGHGWRGFESALGRPRLRDRQQCEKVARGCSGAAGWQPEQQARGLKPAKGARDRLG